MSELSHNIEFTEEELWQLPNTISITRQVGTTHPNLGIRTTFMELIDIANMGCMQVSVMGAGKTASLLAIKNMARRQVFTKKFTLAASRRFSKLFTNNFISWICLEMSDLSDMVMENMLRVVGDIIYDHSCEINTSSYVCNITNATISWLAACTYEIFNAIWPLKTWRGTTKDRVLRYFAFLYNTDWRKINLKPPAPQITLNFPPLNEVEIETDYYPEIVKLLESQFSLERSVDYAQRLLKASAALNHRDAATDADAKFILLHRCNIEAEHWSSHKKSISSPLEIDVDAMQILAESMKTNGISMKELAKRETLDGGVSTIIASIYNHPDLLVRQGDWVFPNPTLLASSIAPQIKFERLCLTRGTRYYSE